MPRNIAKPFNMDLSLLDVTPYSYKYKCFSGEDVELIVKVKGVKDRAVDLTGTNCKLFYILQGTPAPTYRQETNIDVIDSGTLRILVTRNYLRVGVNVVRIALFDSDQNVYLQPVIITCIDPGITDDTLPPPVADPSINDRVIILETTISDLSDRLLDVETGIDGIDGIDEVVAKVDEAVAKVDEVMERLDGLDNIPETTQPIIEFAHIAHRGLSSVKIENTIEAYMAAAKVGLKYVECDVQITSDNKFVLFHDTTLSRLCGKSTAVANMTYTEVRDSAFTSGNGLATQGRKQIATLTEFLQCVKRYDLIPVIEMSPVVTWTETRVADFYAYIRNEVVTSNCYVISFNKDVLTMLRALDPKIKLMYLVEDPATTDLDICLKLAPCGLGCNYTNLINDSNVVAFIQQAHLNSIWIDCYTINDYTNYMKAKKLGIDMITSDNVY